ncbi:MAG: recombinase family protein [Oscillospiraceae bacterium]|nr:recombinase family protein [Oscillospiraceae bacterium]
MTGPEWRTGLYLRLSRDDDQGSESASITNQRSILTEYARRNGLEIVGEFVDDGWSGTNYDRPAFRRMIAGVEAGQINCVAVKDGCVNIELNSESPQKCGFCDVSSVF